MHDAYAAHYYDASSLQYRREFILKPLLALAGSEFGACRLVEVASGSGYNSLILEECFPGISLTGIDISPSACADYRALTGQPAYEIDMTKPLVAQLGQPFDVAMVIGGLHHCLADLSGTLRNLAKLVRPGGLLLMMEPNRRYVLEGVRRLWYRFDRSFDAANEGALDHDEIAGRGMPWFEVVDVRYGGGPAFFLIQNSMITRVPLSWKPGLVRVLFPLERLNARIPFRFVHAFFVAVWQRLDTAG
jgi:SAM-dependent methyltransferase